jgi:hypothetical protein
MLNYGEIRLTSARVDINVVTPRSFRLKLKTIWPDVNVLGRQPTFAALSQFIPLFCQTSTTLST